MYTSCMRACCLLSLVVWASVCDLLKGRIALHWQCTCNKLYSDESCSACSQCALVYITLMSTNTLFITIVHNYLLTCYNNPCYFCPISVSLNSHSAQPHPWNSFEIQLALLKLKHTTHATLPQTSLLIHISFWAWVISRHCQMHESSVFIPPVFQPWKKLKIHGRFIDLWIWDNWAIKFEK